MNMQLSRERNNFSVHRLRHKNYFLEYENEPRKDLLSKLLV